MRVNMWPPDLAQEEIDSVVENSWISQSDSHALQNRIQCFGVASEDYLVSHVGALQVAYSAFAADDDLDYSRRPVSRNLTEAQVFFLMLCRTMCHVTKSRPRSIRQLQHAAQKLAALLRSLPLCSRIANEPEKGNAASSNKSADHTLSSRCEYLICS
ncbi:hypothetical protein MRX96_013347 [Rhipicephalus microplus]